MKPTENLTTETEQIAETRNRLAALPPDLAERVHDALKHEPLEHAANLLWKAGTAFSTAELYEYRKTLFPPNALLDPYTADAPVLRPEFAEHRYGGSVNAPDAASPQLDEARQRLVQVLSARPRTVREGAVPPAPGPEHEGGPGSPPSQQTNSETTSNPSIQQSINPAAILTDLRELIQRYVVLPDLAAETLALWLVHTYAFSLRQVTTYIGVVSPEKRCGKTTLLELLGLLANRSLTAANISPSALFRVIQETRPTLLIDEADTFLQGRDEIAGILNAGYRKGNSYVVRVSDGKTRKKPDTSTGGRASSRAAFGEWSTETIDGAPGATEFAQYSCWCPKVMAAIGRLPDTLADRCILITMQRKMPGEKCERLRHLDAAEYRRRCAEFVRAHSEAIAAARPEIPSTLNDRAADIWEPLLAIADLAGEDWPALARQAAQKLSASDDEIPLIGYFLKDLRAIMLLKNVDRILSRDIVATLNPMHHRPWEDLRRGRQINEWWLGHKMSELGIRSRSVRSGEHVGKGYVLPDIDAAIRRYVPNADGHTPQRPKAKPPEDQ